ncbi:unnamed protein product [Calicophoron daubneyi]|uniref:Ligand of Numb protein X 2 n=1 Tax=Calicophoron daubneyi TaxID=300641 RepID=A0AAV2TYJ9_CALDB
MPVINPPPRQFATQPNFFPLPPVSSISCNLMPAATATVRPMNMIPMPPLVSASSIANDTFVLPPPPHVPSVNASVVETPVGCVKDNPSFAASRMGGIEFSGSVITSAFRTIPPQNTISYLPSTTDCILSFPAPPKESFMSPDSNGSRPSICARTALPTISTNSTKSVSSVLPIPNATTQPVPPDRLFTNLALEAAPKPLNHLPTPQTTVASQNTNQSPSIQSVNEASTTLWCTVCGHMHDLSNAHIYEYSEPVDADLLCRLCHQPLVDPLDTKCGHTFCSLCLKNHLAVQALCPEDKQIINYLECQQSSNLVKRLLDKLLVICPNSEYCNEVLARCDLESHLAYWCRGAIVACVNNKLGCPYLGLRAKQPAHRWNCQFQPPVTKTTTGLSVNQPSAQAASLPPTVSPQMAVNEMIACQKSPGVEFCTNSVPGKIPLVDSGSSVSNNLHPNSSNSHSAGSGSDISVLPDTQIARIELKSDGRMEFGISIVGGCDTPLLCIIVQEIYLDGIAAQDGRLRPGDQILEVNGQELTQLTHLQACSVLSKASGPVCRLTICREQGLHTNTSLQNSLGPSKPVEKQEILRIVLPKCQEKPLGIKIAGKKNFLGLYVLGLVPNGEAQLDGRLHKDDRILDINGVDLSNGTQEQAAQLIQEAKDTVSLVVVRQLRPQTPDIIRATSGENVSKCVAFADPTVSPMPARSADPSGQATAPSSTSNSLKTAQSTVPTESDSQSSTASRISQERVVVLRKQPGESLGMSVAGGVASQRGDLPIYVTNLNPEGIATLSGQVFRGDILLAVNQTELLGLSHERAVEALKNARDSCAEVTLRLLKGPESSIEARNFIPSWLFWLQLPRYCQIPRLVVLMRDPVMGLGFSIIGGNDFHPSDASVSGASGTTVPENQKPAFPRPIVIKSIVPGSPCFHDGRLKCGDILLSVDHYPLTDISHAHAVALLKHCSGEVKLRYVSWPGTIV